MLCIQLRQGGKPKEPHVLEQNRWNVRSIVKQELYRQGNDEFREWFKNREMYLETTPTGYLLINVPASCTVPFVRHQARWMISRLNKWKTYLSGRAVEDYAELNLVFEVKN